MKGADSILVHRRILNFVGPRSTKPLVQIFAAHYKVPLPAVEALNGEYDWLSVISDSLAEIGAVFKERNQPIDDLNFHAYRKHLQLLDFKQQEQRLPHDHHAMVLLRRIFHWSQCRSYSSRLGREAQGLQTAHRH